MIQRSTIRRGLPFYIESDGKPMGETPLHIRNIRYLLEPLESWFAADPMVYVGGNMFVHFERGNRNRHVSPDVFVVRGVPRDVDPPRRSYRVWEEGRPPDVVIEVTSRTTRRTDQGTKRTIYQDVLRVREYFLFDPYEEYLHPRFQGFRLWGGAYRPIKPVGGRLPSKGLGLHLEPVGDLLRLYDPAAKRWLPIPPEVQAEWEAEAEARRQAEGGEAAEALARRRAEAARDAEAQARRRAEEEADRLRRELDELRRRLPPTS